jgi:hypothetical protein
VWNEIRGIHPFGKEKVMALLEAKLDFTMKNLDEDDRADVGKMSNSNKEIASNRKQTVNTYWYLASFSSHW